MTIYIGIDPGLVSGAYAAIDHNGAFLACGDIANNGDRIHPRMLKIALQEIIRNNGNDAEFVIESVFVRPGQGMSSTGKFMRACGAIETVVDLLLYPYEMVTPQAWKKHHGLIGTDKKASLALARTMWPTAPLKLVKHHGRADALLMAGYLWCKNN
ncbi:Crossover junction endodeoxyribonuclease RuvC [uncultured Caudovirales phage]|uniref:Crossover junction endodeoxyribonuclease RuvC n=1 Tax=uncultured Caudovirales phage TaxID=2100421 RepID=A0A6J5RXW0_9CAUD|nr:Crossover junction endodeoxyribonuclease RuvC [uncultured Caudovirales phage]